MIARLRRIVWSTMLVSGTILFGSTTQAQERDPDQTVQQICYGITDGTGGSKELFAQRQQMCALAIRQGLSKGNAEYVSKLEAALGKCTREGRVVEISNADTRNRIYAIKDVTDLTKDDVASIVRYAANCWMLKAGEDSMSGLGMAMIITTDAVQQYVLGDWARARAEREQITRLVERSKVEDEQRSRHVAELQSKGYESMALLDLKVDAKSLHGQKVAVSGLVQVVDNDTAVMLANQNDTNGVVLLIGNSSREVRQRILGQCASLGRPCRLEVKGTVVGNRPVAAISVE